MLTHCPHCDTCFRVTSEQLEIAQGHVRCGRCFGTFLALENLVDSQPEEQATTAATPPEDPRQTTAQATAPLESQDEAPPPPPQTIEANEDTVERSQRLVDAIQSSPPADEIQKKGFGLWLSLSLVLGLLFISQYSYFHVTSLAQNKQLRPALKMLCSISPCELPLLHNPSMIALVERDIRSHPTQEHALQLRATITNQARETLAYPTIALSLHDISGKTIAERSFRPKEYLPASTALDAGISSQQNLEVALDLVDPGEDAVGFEFEFL